MGRLGKTAMLRRVLVVIGVVGVTLLLGSCTKCGPIWDDWTEPQKSCRSDHL
jgi:hypothetical protein